MKEEILNNCSATSCVFDERTRHFGSWIAFVEVREWVVNVVLVLLEFILFSAKEFVNFFVP